MKAYELMNLLANLQCNAEVFVREADETAVEIESADTGDGWITINPKRESAEE